MQNHYLRNCDWEMRAFQKGKKIEKTIPSAFPRVLARLRTKNGRTACSYPTGPLWIAAFFSDKFIYHFPYARQRFSQFDVTTQVPWLESAEKIERKRVVEETYESRERISPILPDGVDDREYRAEIRPTFRGPEGPCTFHLQLAHSE